MLWPADPVEILLGQNIMFFADLPTETFSLVVHLDTKTKRLPTPEENILVYCTNRFGNFGPRAVRKHRPNRGVNASLLGGHNLGLPHRVKLHVYKIMGSVFGVIFVFRDSPKSCKVNPKLVHWRGQKSLR